MSITAILSDKELDSAEKLKQVAAVVAKAREAYGNVNSQIPAVDVNTVSGMMSFVHLDNDAKVSVLRSEVQTIKVRAIEYSSNVEGSNLNKKLEELIATNGMFANIESSTEFDYI